MTATRCEIRKGAYFDSVMLMQLQRTLAGQPGIADAGVVMGTAANKALLAQSGLLPDEARAAAPDDLIIVVKGDQDAAPRAMAKVDEFLRRPRSMLQQEYRPHSVETAADLLPAAAWVLVSVAGRYAAGVAHDALRLGKHVFLFSDNVPVEEEVQLKREAWSRGLLVMGPDCGTALVAGVGLGFANKIRRGPVGIVAAAGTGLQHVSSRIHQLGGGITHGLGSGGRDLSESVGALTFRQSIDLLARDPDTRVMVLISKPPAPGIAGEVLKQAAASGKPVVVAFVGQHVIFRQVDNCFFAAGLDEAARLAVELASAPPPAPAQSGAPVSGFAAGQRYVRGLFSGGTLAYEAQHLLRGYAGRILSNAPLRSEDRLPDPLISQGHSIIDLGADEFTVGRLHPMMDNSLRIRRLQQEAADPETAVILLDVVLGYGSHPDPAGELAPAIAHARASAQSAGRVLEIIVVVTGTAEDPQDLGRQCGQLRQVGAHVETSHEAALLRAGRVLAALEPAPACSVVEPGLPVDLGALRQPLAVINVGLERFAEQVIAQGAQAVDVDWRPPAGGNERLMAILAKMKAKQRGTP